MPIRLIDFEAMWSSDKLFTCAVEARREYAWLYGLADAHGSFEITNLRVIHGRVAPIREDLSLEQLGKVFDDFHANGILFIWEQGGKRYGHWTNCEGRLPAKSLRDRYARLAPPVPEKELDEYLAKFSCSRVEPFKTTSRPALDFAMTGLGLGVGLGLGKPSRPSDDVNSASSRDGDSSKTNPEHLKTVQARVEWEAPVSPLATEFLNLWNANRGSLPEVRELTKGRMDKLRARLRARPNFRQEFEEATRKAAASPFMRGESERGWCCSFDFLIANDTNVVKILEGKYDSKGGGAAGGGNRKPSNAISSARNTDYSAGKNEVPEL